MEFGTVDFGCSKSNNSASKGQRQRFMEEKVKSEAEDQEVYVRCNHTAQHSEVIVTTP